jgi:hypothetical protein
MVFNLKKSQLANPVPTPAPPVVDMNSLDFIAAAGKVLALNPDYDNIHDFMRDMDLTPEEVLKMGQQTDVETLQDAQDPVGRVNDAAQTIQNTMPGAMASVKPFNLKKAQEAMPPMDPMGLNDGPELVGDNLQTQQGVLSTPIFKSHIEFKVWLDNTDDIEIMRVLSENDADNAKEAVENYLQMKVDLMVTEESRADFVHEIYKMLPSHLKDEGGEFLATPRHFGEINDTIKKLAENTVKKQKKETFNLKKFAQHKTLNNAIVWGPGQTRIDPFLHQPVSDWHIVERNKGFGLVVDDVWNIDYETIWRNNVMDKFYRPYRDSKTGEWKGGYLHKRFEMDKNIPESSNYQLKPGQKRRPILPEYGNIEARLQAARAAGTIEGGPVVDRTKPFNWKEAQTKKKR